MVSDRLDELDEFQSASKLVKSECLSKPQTFGQLCQ